MLRMLVFQLINFPSRFLSSPFYLWLAFYESENDVMVSIAMPESLY